MSSGIVSGPFVQPQAIKPPRITKSGPTVVFSLATIIIVVVVIEAVDLPADTRLWQEIQDSGHVPLFGILALAALALSTELLGKRLQKRYQHYLLALAVSIVLAGGTEWIQSFTGRDADFRDALRDILGAVSFLILYLLFDSRMRLLVQARKPILIVISVTLFCLPLAPLGFWTIAYVYRDLAFPEIVSFESFWQRQFLATKDAKLTLASAPRQWEVFAGKQVGRVVLEPGAYPGFWVQEPYPDWRGYRFLRFDIYSEMSYPVGVTLRIHDRWHNNQYSDRFNYRLDVAPGSNRYEISLERIEAGPARRELDMKNISAIALFAVNLRDRYTLDINGIWLK